jgi:serine/threonine protein kinase
MNHDLPDPPLHLTAPQALDLMRMGLAGPDESRTTPHLDGFELGAVIGRGGMGTVHLARQLDLDREVVVKLVTPGLSRDPEFVERLTREARLMAGLRHPNIVVVHQLAGTADGDMAIVMEHVPGGNLRDLLRGHPDGLPVDLAHRFFLETASALGAAHALGVIHRDVKPENILLDARGSVRVADFGLALRPDDPAPRLTVSSSTVGTTDYMAPERFESNHADVRSDIYALGVVLYEMLTGKVPRGSFAPPHRVRSGVPIPLGEAVMKALRPDPDARFASMAEFASAAEPAANVSRRSWLVGASATIVVGTGTWFATRPRNAKPPTPAKPPTTWQNILATANPAAHTISGSWQRIGDLLESDSAISILSQNISLPADYDLRLSFTRLTGVHSVAVFLTANGSTGTVDVDGWGENLSGVQAIEGRDLRQGGGFRFPLENGREYLLEIEVRGGRIRVSIDGIMKSEQTFGPRALSVVFPWQWNPPVTASLLGIGSYESQTRFHRFEWRAAH